MDLFISYLDETTNNLKSEGKKLRMSDRNDESDIIKIKINIYGMCKAIYQTVVKQCSHEDLLPTYLKRLNEFPENWEQACSKAKEFNDAKRVLVEQTKLNTLKEIRSSFLQIRGDNDELH